MSENLIPANSHPPRAGASVVAPDQDIWHYFGVIRRWWWFVVITAGVALFISWWSQLDDAKMFTAEVLLQQKQPSSTMMFPFASGTGSDFGTHLDIIRSNEVMGPVVDSLGLQLRLQDKHRLRTRLIGPLDAERNAPRGEYWLAYRNGFVELRLEDDGEALSRAFPGEAVEGPGFSLVVADPTVLTEPLEILITNFDLALEVFRNRLVIEQGSGADLIWIRATVEDPEFAARVVNKIAESYQLQRSSNAKEEAVRRRRIIANQLADVADSLEAVQTVVIDYQERTRLANPEAEGMALTSELLAADARRRELSYQVRLLGGLVAGLETSGDGDASLQQILALGSELVPQIPELSRRISELELERSQLTGSTFGRTAMDPQVQQVDSMIATAKGAAKVAAQQSLSLMRTQLSEEENRYSALRGQAGALPARTAEFGRLSDRVNVVQGVFDDLVGKYYEAQIAEGIESGDIDIVAAAAVPVLADRSRRGLKTMVALLAGLLIGIVGALMLDQLDSRIRRAADVERAANLAVVGTIPNIRSLTSGSMSLQVGKDAFRTLRTHLRFASEEQPRLIAVTSATPRDGKSTVAANLALTLAEQGSRTLLIDSDLRRPQVHTTFSIPQAPGLSDVLLGEATLDDSLNHQPEPSSLDILTCGTGIENPTELIGSEVFDRFIESVRGLYDHIVIDTPPLLAVTDGALVSALVDGTLVVVRANKTDQVALENAVNQLRRLRVPILGVVLNGVPTGRTAGYSYYPSHYPSYATGGETPEEPKRPLLRSRHIGRRAG